MKIPESELVAGLRTVMAEKGELELLLGAMNEGVLVLDGESRIVRTNRAANELLGIRTTTIRNRPVIEVARHAALNRFIQQLLQEDREQLAEFTIDADGERVVQASGTPLFDDQGNRFGSLITLHDVTRLHRLERIRQDLVANVSHELRTPITAIKGFVETLQAGAMEEPERARRFLDIIGRQAARMEAIVDDLLTLSQLDSRHSQQETLLRSPTDIRQLAREAAEVCRQNARQRSIELTIDVAVTKPCLVNPALLEQALINLLDNAIKFSPDGSEVRLGAHCRDGELEIAVQDRGIGIRRDQHQRVFERFFRVDRGRSRRQGGTGLGLAIVKHVAQVHGGVVAVESAPGQGSTFTLRLPLPAPTTDSDSGEIHD